VKIVAQEQLKRVKAGCVAGFYEGLDPFPFFSFIFFCLFFWRNHAGEFISKLGLRTAAVVTATMFTRSRKDPPESRPDHAHRDSG